MAVDPSYASVGLAGAGFQIAMVSSAGVNQGWHRAYRSYFKTVEKRAEV
jgi:hypothetical protein